MANTYIKEAERLNREWYTSIPPSWKLSFFPSDSDLGMNYYHDMMYCMEFAKKNREVMVLKTIRAISRVTEISLAKAFDGFFDVHHNYLEATGNDYYLHRKGALDASLGKLVIIPGSQGTGSYICVGKGNARSYNSCSHGAGRVMSRSKARKELSLEEEIAFMEEKGIVHGIRSVSDLDEATSAYKDIDAVMANQTDLVRPMVYLKPIAVIKG